MTDWNHAIGEYQLQQAQPGTWPGEGYVGQHQTTQEEAFLHHLTPQDLPASEDTDAAWQMLQQRIPALLALSHQGLLSYKRCLGPTAQEIWLMRPHTPADARLPGSLKALLTSQSPGKLNARNALHMYAQINEALGYLHGRSLFHGALSLDVIGMDWQQRPPTIQLAQPGLCIDHAPREQRPEGQRDFQPPDALVASRECQVATPQQRGQWRDRYALGAIVWRMVTGATPPPEPPYQHAKDDAAPWPWPLAEPPTQELLQAWRDCFALPSAAEHNPPRVQAPQETSFDTLPWVGPSSAPKQPSPTTHKEPTVRNPLPASLSKTIPYDEALQDAIQQTLQPSPEQPPSAPMKAPMMAPTMASDVQIDESTSPEMQPPSHAGGLEHLDDLPPPIPESWEQEAIRIDAELDRRSRGKRQWGLWMMLLLLLFVGWLWRSLCNK